ncbi:hypothetical protein [Longispora urticae]
MSITDAVSVVVAALGAGALAATRDGVEAAVSDLYTALRDRVRDRLTRRDREVLTAHEGEPGRWEVRLRDVLRDGGGVDDELVELARRLLAAADPAGSAEGKYTIVGSGAVVGDTTIHVTGTNLGAVGTFNAPVTFHPPPDPPSRPTAR